MKKLLIVGLLGLTVALPGHAAPQQTSNFDVTVNLTSKCEFTPAGTAVTLNYTSFQVGDATGTTTIGMRCTTGLAYTLTLDGAGAGTALGLPYTLALTGASNTGTGANETITVTGTIAGGLVGTCASASCTATDVRTLTVNY